MPRHNIRFLREVPARHCGDDAENDLPSIGFAAMPCKAAVEK
jgi:hypothetical protein